MRLLSVILLLGSMLVAGGCQSDGPSEEISPPTDCTSRGVDSGLCQVRDLPPGITQ